MVFSLELRQELLPVYSLVVVAAWLRGYEAEDNRNSLTPAHFFTSPLHPSYSYSRSGNSHRLLLSSLLGLYDCDFSDGLVRILQPFSVSRSNRVIRGGLTINQEPSMCYSLRSHRKMSRPTSPSTDSSDEASDISEATDSSEEWLDELCLEPLASPESGYAKLCNACKRVFCVYPGKYKWANHIQYTDTLVRSAQRGCVLCPLLLYKIEGKDPSYRHSP